MPYKKCIFKALFLYKYSLKRTLHIKASVYETVFTIFCVGGSVFGGGVGLLTTCSSGTGVYSTGKFELRHKCQGFADHRCCDLKPRYVFVFDVPRAATG